MEKVVEKEEEEVVMMVMIVMGVRVREGKSKGHEGQQRVGTTEEQPSSAAQRARTAGRRSGGSRW